MVEFLTGAMLSGIVYDMIKNSVNMTVENLQQKLEGWVVDAATSQKILNKINNIQSIEEHSEIVLTRKFEQDTSFLELLKTIKPNQSMKQVQITQTNTYGDNIGRDKIIKSPSEK